MLIFFHFKALFGVGLNNLEKTCSLKINKGVVCLYGPFKMYWYCGMVQFSMKRVKHYNCDVSEWNTITVMCPMQLLCRNSSLHDNCTCHEHKKKQLNKPTSCLFWLKFFTYLSFHDVFQLIAILATTLDGVILLMPECQFLPMGTAFTASVWLLVPQCKGYRNCKAISFFLSLLSVLHSQEVCLYLALHKQYLRATFTFRSIIGLSLPLLATLGNFRMTPHGARAMKAEHVYPN